MGQGVPVGACGLLAGRAHEPGKPVAWRLQALRAGRSWGLGRRYESCPGLCDTPGKPLECRALGQLHEARPAARAGCKALGLETMTDTCAGCCQGQEEEPGRPAALSGTELRGGSRGVPGCAWVWEVWHWRKRRPNHQRLEYAGNF